MQRFLPWIWPVVLLVPIAVALWGWRPCTGPATTVILVRHAEKELAGRDPSLTPAGEARAEELARVLTPASPSAIFASEYRRTQQTVRPLADALGVAIITIDAADVQGLVDAILADRAGQTVLVAGHSNTVPGLIEALGAPAVPEIGDGDYDNLYIVTVPCGGDAQVTHLAFGPHQ